MGIGIAVSAASWAAPVNTYQVTGPVLDVKSDAITVQKGSERWEIARDASTKVDGDLKVGSKVTIQYRMTAVQVDVKPEKAAKKK
jgi:hypothetical protein